MAQMQKMEETFELKCSAEKIFEMMRDSQPHISKVCSNKVSNAVAHHGDWLSVGSTRKWDLLIGEKKTDIVDRIESIDEGNMKLTRRVIDGEMMKHYKTLKIHFQSISKGNNNNSCVLIYGLEYEKKYENAPEPNEFLTFGVDVLKDLADHLSN